jgi:hypothetical protein
MRRALVARRAGTWRSLGRTVAGTGLAEGAGGKDSAGAGAVVCHDSDNQPVGFAAKTPEGRCASALSFRSAFTCSIMACGGGSCPLRPCPGLRYPRW